MKMNFEKGKYIASVSKAFVKKAQTFGTPEFYEWRAVCKEFGTHIELVVKNNRKHPNANKNLTYENMVIYMNTLENARDYLNTFEVVKQYSKIQPNPTKYVLDWFKETFPNYKETMDVIIEEKKATEENVIEMTEKVSA